MGNYKFRLLDMMPNVWFYKLKDMGRKKNQNTTHPTKKKQPPTSTSTSTSTSSIVVPPHPPKLKPPHQRKSYYYTRELTPPPPPPPLPPRHDTFYNNLTTIPNPTTTNFQDPPRKSSKKRRSTKRNRQSPRVVTSSVSAGCSCRATIESVWTQPDSTPEEYPNSPLDTSSEHESLLPEFGSDRDSFDNMVSWSTSCRCRFGKGVGIEMGNNSFDPKFEKLDGFHGVSEIELRPIITKPDGREKNDPPKFRRSSAKIEERNAYGSLSVKVIKEDIINASSKEQRTSPVRRISANSPGVRLRTTSPRIGNRKIQVHGRKSVSSVSNSGTRKSLSESCAVVKISQDPQRDFKESMVEMIMENNIRASKDLEELLACYLSLNSDEYHDLIIKVFKQIWFDISDIRLK